MKLFATGPDVRKIREATGLSQEKFGALFGFSREHVSKIERQATLTIVQKWFYWYIKNYGLPREPDRGG